MTNSSFDFDALCSSQVHSKLWLCRELEKRFFWRPVNIWVLAGWYGVLGFLLMGRERLRINSIRIFDQDPEACRVADQFNESWLWKGWSIKAFQMDVNQLSFTGSTPYGPSPDIVINTSCEHFAEHEWFEKLPQGQLVAVQGSSLPLEDHVDRYSNLAEFSARFPLRKVYFEGEMPFSYPDKNFSRFMKIGKK